MITRPGGSGVDALDEDSRRVLAVFAEVFPEGMHRLPIAEARERHKKLAQAGPPGPEVHQVVDRTVRAPSGDVPVRVYYPGPEPRPVLVWCHGGAFALGSLETADAFCRELVTAADIVVVSVDYRLAPEYPFPAGLDDCFAVFTEVAQHPESFGAVAPVAIGGDSAGATLAAAVVLRCRDEDLPLPAFQLLAYPTTAMRISSYEHANAPVVPASMASHFWSEYVRSDEDLLSPYCAPLAATSLSGLSPAFVVVPEVDSTRADQLEYSIRMADAGVMTTVKTYPGTAHGFFTAPAAIRRAREALNDAAQHISFYLHGDLPHHRARARRSELQ